MRGLYFFVGDVKEGSVVETSVPTGSVTLWVVFEPRREPWVWKIDLRIVRDAASENVRTPCVCREVSGHMLGCRIDTLTNVTIEMYHGNLTPSSKR